MKCWNRFASEMQLLFCYSSELSALNSWLSSDEFTKQQQNDNSKILVDRFQYFTGMMITAKDWNRSAYQLSKKHNYRVSLEWWLQQNVVFIQLAWAPNHFETVSQHAVYSKKIKYADIFRSAKLQRYIWYHITFDVVFTHSLGHCESC